MAAVIRGERPLAVDLFAGAGGLSLGLEQAGFDVVASVEYDPIHAATHEFNFRRCTSICASVANLSGADIRRQAGLDPDEHVDLVAGGPPCQGFSMIGKRSVGDDRNNLVFEFLRIVGELEPRYFVMENVPGMMVGQQAGLLALLVSHSEELGYHCEVQLLTATEFGVPQKRTRLILVGTRSDCAAPPPVQPTTAGIGTQSDLPACPSVGDALGGLPDAEEFPELLERDWVEADVKCESPYAESLRGRRRPGDFSYARRWDNQLLTSSLRTVHTPKSIRRFRQTQPGTVESVSRFLRLDPNGVANTLRAGTDSKRGAHTSPRPIHPVHNRVITVREAARLHGFPDWFRFHATKWHGFRQVGNAVVPPVGRAVGQSVMGAMKVEPRVPKGAIGLGEERLLTMPMTEAARHFEVPADVVGTRDRHLTVAG